MTPARVRLGNVIALNERGAALLEHIRIEEENRQLREELERYLGFEPIKPVTTFTISDLFKRRD